MLADNDVIKMAVEIFWGFKIKHFLRIEMNLNLDQMNQNVRFDYRMKFKKFTYTKDKQWISKHHLFCNRFMVTVTSGQISK